MQPLPAKGRNPRRPFAFHRTPPTVKHGLREYDNNILFVKIVVVAAISALWRSFALHRQHSISMVANTTTTANDTITNQPRRPKLITLSLFIGKYAGGSSLPVSSQTEADDGPWPSIARHGRHRTCRRCDDNGENTPGSSSPRLHTTKRELAVALARPDMAHVPTAGHGPSPRARWPLALHRPPRTAQNMSAIRH